MIVYYNLFTLKSTYQYDEMMDSRPFSILRRKRRRENTWHLPLRWDKGIFVFTDLPRKSPIYMQLGRDTEAVLRGIFVMGSCEYMQLFFKWFMKGFLFAFKMWNKRTPFPEASLTEVLPSPELPADSAMGWNHRNQNPHRQIKRLSSASSRLGSLSNSFLLEPGL